MFCSKSRNQVPHGSILAPILCNSFFNKLKWQTALPVRSLTKNSTAPRPADKEQPCNLLKKSCEEKSLKNRLTDSPMLLTEGEKLNEKCWYKS